MSDKRKTYVVVTVFKGKRELQAYDEEAARKAAIASGWWVKEVYEKPQEKKAA